MNVKMSMDNPFYHRGAIRRLRDFYNREAEISQILGLLRNGQSVSLIGPRRIGKSSLLIHLTRSEVRSANAAGTTKRTLCFDRLPGVWRLPTGRNL